MAKAFSFSYKRVSRRGTGKGVDVLRKRISSKGLSRKAGIRVVGSSGEVFQFTPAPQDGECKVSEDGVKKGSNLDETLICLP